MKRISIIGILILLTTILFAQDPPKKIKLYQAKIWSIYDENQIKGTFYTFNDSSIVLINTKSINEITKYQFQFQNIPVNTIDKIRIRRNGGIEGSILLGAVSGLTAGVIIGFALGDDEPPCGWWSEHSCMTAGDKAVLAGVPLTIIGAVIGGIVAKPDVLFEIHGMSENIRLNQELLSKYTIVVNQ